MDLADPEWLAKIFTVEEKNQVPAELQEKLKKYLSSIFDEYYKEKAAAHRLPEYEQKNEEYQAQIKDLENKLQNYEKNVAELRTQLDFVSAERTRLMELVNNYEKNLASARQEKNSIIEERDSLLKVTERQNSEVSRLQLEIREQQQQLKNAIKAKCEAIARVDEIESKETTLEFKEKRLEQEKLMWEKQVQTLSEDLNRNMMELQNVRRGNNIKHMHIETKLAEKIEELKILQTQCDQYKETNSRLSQSVQELTSKMLNQSEETNKMIDFYKKEIEAKTKLADLYKGNCDDTVMEQNELSAANVDLRRMLAEASEQYGELETKLKAFELKHEQELEEKNKEIESLKTEILHANDLLKEVKNESMEKAIAKLAPTAAIASRLIRSDMSLTELYSLYVKTSEELDARKREISHLNHQLKTILNELNESAPAVKKQEIDYEKLVETHNIIIHQRDDLLAKKAEMEEVMMDAHAKINHLERENRKLKHTQNDLSRQVCYLLKELEYLRVGAPADHASHCGSMTTIDEVISKKLVTFNSIDELLANNQKLLLLVRDLSGKLENAESLKETKAEASYQEKLENYMKKFQNMQETLNKQNNTVAMLVSKCERYKKLYFELHKQLNNSQAQANISDLDDNDMEVDNADGNQSKRRSTVNGETSTKGESTEKRVRDLEKQLQDVNEQYKRLKEQHEFYCQEKKNNDKIMNEQFDSMRSEVRELTSANCKLNASLEYTTEQVKLLQKNQQAYKTQVTALEDRNKNYENIIFKHEQTVNYLKDEVMKSQQGHAAAESEAHQLRHENRILKDAATRLQSEKESYLREQQSQSLLLNNIELIKTNLERSEMEGRARLEQRLDETVRELAAQRRRFQEEESRYRETINELKRSSDAAKKRMEDEKLIAEKYATELNDLRKELALKTQQIDDLSKKLQESLTPSRNDNPIALANKKIRELENHLEEARIEISSLSSDLHKAREHSDQYFKMSQCAEAEIKSLHEIHTSFVAKAEADINALKLIESNLKSRIAELEAEVKLSSISQSSSDNADENAQSLQDELKVSLEKLSDCNRNIRALRSENTTLSESLNDVATKYANEMVLHSADIKELTKLKAEFSTIQDQINQMRSERDAAQDAYKEINSSKEGSIRMLEEEKLELEKRIDGLNELNSNLHNQIEILTTKLSILTQTQPPSSANNSLIDPSSSSANTSMTGLANESYDGAEDKNSEQLLQIIKFLRREKDLTIAKMDILKAENTRLLSEHTMLQKKIDELKDCLSQERSKSDTTIASAFKHEEILRKIETLNAITDSNRILRDERNTLERRVKELNDHVSKVEEELMPLHSQNRDLSSKVEKLAAELAAQLKETAMWRQRANILVEKSNKDPEEFSRLQAEREHLAQMFSREKAKLSKVEEELTAVKADKLRVEAELTAMQSQLQTLAEEKKKLADDLAASKQTNSRLMQEVMELKNKVLHKEDALQKITDSLEKKDAQLTDLKNKEVQIRKIAKRYKDSYMDLTNKMATNVGGSGAVAGGGAGPEAGNSGSGGLGNPQDSNELMANLSTEGGTQNISTSEVEQLRSTVASYTTTIKELNERNDQLSKEVEDLRAAAEVEDRTKVILRDAKARIVSLTDAKTATVQELNAAKQQLQNVLEANENHATLMQEMKSRYDETISGLEKELQDNKEAYARLSRENEALVTRTNQLGRQLNIQQSTKPSTSSVAISDKINISESSPRTANVKPMSGSTTVQQSATVTPWRGSETPLASIRPISVQNSRTAAILPTSQQSSSSSSSGSSAPSNTASSNAASNTALVPPQQQVHTTGSSSVESMSSSPTSSHNDYIPSTSSASVAVAAIPPMGSSTAAESSQEAESVQQTQSNESQVMGSGVGQQQVVALVSPRVEGSQNASPNLNLQQEALNQQPSTSGAASSLSHIPVSSHSRHTPSSSSVTTTQASLSGPHKRPRDVEGDSSSTAEDSDVDKANKHPKRMRMPLVGSESASITDSGADVEYQVPTSSQRDQEDDIVIVDTDEEDDLAEADDGPTEVEVEHEGYEDSYEQDQDVDDNGCTEANASSIRVEADNNEVDVFEGADNQSDPVSYTSGGASTSQAAAEALAYSQQRDNHQQSQAISSGSCESHPDVLPSGQVSWKQPSSVSHTRQQKPAFMMMQQGAGANVTESEQNASGNRCSSGCIEIVSSPQESNIAYSEAAAHSEGNDIKEPAGESSPSSAETSQNKERIEGNANADENATDGGDKLPEAAENIEDADVDAEFGEEAAVAIDMSENADSESQSNSATQSEMQDVQQSQVEGTSDDNEATDGVTSEGEKQLVGETEEEGREAEATTTPSLNTRSKATRGSPTMRRTSRGAQRGNRPTPIVWQETPGTSRSMPLGQRNLEQSGSPIRGYPNQRNQRARRMRRPGGNFSNMRYNP